MTTPRLCGLLFVALAAAFPAAAQPLAPRDFARGVRVNPSTDAPLQIAVLPEAVYRTATRADLGDVRVFNAAGEELPHALVESPGGAPAQQRTRALPFFPVYGPPGADLGALSLRIRRTPSGTLVQMDEPRTGAPASQPVRAYLIDASRLDTVASALRLAWPEAAPDFVAEARIEASDDLRAWTAGADPATLARLRHDGRLLERTEIPAPPGKARYFRLTWTGDPLPPPSALEAVVTRLPEGERRWTALRQAGAGEGYYLFDQQGVLPVDRVRFALAQPNTVARVKLSSGPSPEGPWQARYQGLAYRLRMGGREVAAPPPALPGAVRDRYWRLDVDPAGGGLGTAAPVLELGWQPGRLVFVARGAGPYTIAFGAADARPSAYSADELLRLLPGARAASLLRPTAEAGPPFELGGEARLTPALAPPWRRIALWGVLGLAVGLLAFMAARLLRQIDRERRNPEAS